MLGLIQRVSEASVRVENEMIGAIGPGILLLLGIQKDDDQAKADKLLKKILAYRIFSDAEDRMNLSLQQVNGSLLIVPQFTIAADTRKGLRPSFSSAAHPKDGERLYDYFVQQAHLQHPQVATGSFGADMKVSLLNDGPVTFMLDV
ncbi:MAG: D-aminoacyl-tRNA deacylase [Motiliproteus sp.]